MAVLSNAEKERRYRARRDSDNERRQQYLDKEKEKWKKDKEGEKKVSDLSERERRVQRKKWQEKKKKLRDKARGSVMTTPPRSRDNAAQQGPSRQYVVGRSNVRRGRRRLQNQIEKLEATLKREIRKITNTKRETSIWLGRKNPLGQG
ncbi:hypothetical protein KUCAC02_016472 [Chaenocephalus aceratus]|nr:hypothetical protein KUCAC02_016472 [Chaenocephalus aceratus]